MEIDSELIIDLLEALPEDKQKLAIEYIYTLIREWDPDFTKLTPREQKRIDEAREEMKNGEYVRLEDIDWDTE
ncbi:hypothetical protein [Sporosarcina limicola]|uniref:DUF2281 domain-containing protein n=1 Tax=Sporosarcina limicola TaxID=34101 RepID=A0A927MLU1_9BACL|nr:hypothetical protein [Sporosarcina limicola]MBE1555472.1 hypothetical protein [Sporosarcina limicola]